MIRELEIYYKGERVFSENDDTLVYGTLNHGNFVISIANAKALKKDVRKLFEKAKKQNKKTYEKILEDNKNKTKEK